MAMTTYLDKLRKLSRNLWWTWHPEVIAIYRDLNPARWRGTHHSPLAFLEHFEEWELLPRAEEMAIDSRINYAFHRLEEYLATPGLRDQGGPGSLLAQPVAYFSAEFGLHESLPLYSGGLGILAGDHIKSASDLGLPLIGVGLFYFHGYFRQHLDSDGWQQESYGEADLETLPMSLAKGADGQPLMIAVETRDSIIHARVWKAEVGRCTMLLLDSNVDANDAFNRQLTSTLYGGDRSTRIRQELLLGVGGLRALNALGIDPGVLHLNEGHSAFVVLEQARRFMERDGMSWDEARAEVSRMTVFTTHTPVEAGHDRFSPDLVEEALAPLAARMGRSVEDVLAIGRVEAGNPNSLFCMTTLALRSADRANGVSALHGRVSRRMWHRLWPERAEREVPIGHITNGVHVPTWVAPSMAKLYEQRIGSDWQDRIHEPETWRRIYKLNPGELWEAHQLLNSRLVGFARRRSVAQVTRRREGKEAVADASRVLSTRALTIGFARRFATYKRADLLLDDMDRLARLLGDEQRPVQFIYAGKAHPADEPGKGKLQRLFQLSRDPRFKGRLVVLEDYDINVARHMVQGVDLWLNTPRRPLEASGTSGQKVVMNGGLNCSILDGWWAEAYDGANGFAIGGNYHHSDPEVQDAHDREALFRVLEEQVIPLYFQRNPEGIPLGWVDMMKNSIATLAWRFSANRMVRDYLYQCYQPAAGTAQRSRV
ncbi:MAG: alpha-glucan family phosphorylase [Candidatus Krumholzibacteriia bacterium]|nr:alpha-glucan family phosphorylase [bacterium]MCB9513009.1 alpha-glucan family phosphorylase [Candidatus Latescibacterota bacterium]MCB9516332.1 alpha-glucan family phosphorylase [Candidatus Latescibacterota bacterium]